jgi:hypothetical protein
MAPGGGAYVLTYLMTPAPPRAQDKCHPQTIAVCQSRADGLGLKVVVGDEASFSFDKDTSGVLLQYPATDGSIHDYKVGTVLCVLPAQACISGFLAVWPLRHMAYRACMLPSEHSHASR